jgi:hypothetical protein
MNVSDTCIEHRLLKGSVFPCWSLNSVICNLWRSNHLKFHDFIVMITVVETDGRWFCFVVSTSFRYCIQVAEGTGSAPLYRPHESLTCSDVCNMDINSNMATIAVVMLDGEINNLRETSGGLIHETSFWWPKCRKIVLDITFTCIFSLSQFQVLIHHKNDLTWKLFAVQSKNCEPKNG